MLLEFNAVEKVLIFDFDGVLADSLAPMLIYANQVCEEMGYPCIPTKNDLEALETMEFSKFGMQLGIPSEKVDDFVARNLELFNTRDEPLPIFPGMIEVIAELSGNALLAVITGNSRIVVNKFIQNYELGNKFEKVLTTEDEGNRVDKIMKIKKLSTGPNYDFYFIGDSVSDIRAARAAGIWSVAVGWGHQSLQKLILEKPDFTVGEPKELLTMLVGIRQAGWDSRNKI